jgi:hypothetical protein
VKWSGWVEGTTVKTMTGITLLAIGAILTFAVNVHPGFISPQIIGLVLMLTGITGLCLNQRGTGLLDRQLATLRYLLGQDESQDPGRRVPLNDLFGDDLPGEDDTPTSPDIWAASRTRQGVGARRAAQ